MTLIIEHDHENGTRITGSAKGDDVLDLLAPLGWQFRPWIGIHLRGTRDQFSSPGKIEAAAAALTAGGHTVDIDVDDTWRPAAVRYADRADRVDDRVERNDAHAQAASRRSIQARDARQAIGDLIPFGQPKMPGHHSYAGACRDEQRMESHDRRSYDEAGKAKYYADRAAGAAANEAHRNDPRTITRRIETLEKGVRSWQRELAQITPGSSAGYAARAELHIAKDSEEIEYLRGRLAELAATGQFVAWCKELFTPGDHANVGGSWRPVQRVNAKSLSVIAEDGFGYTRTVKYDEVFGRRRDGQQLDKPNGEPWPVALAKKVARWRQLVGRLGVQSCYYTPEWRHTGYAQRLVHGLDLDAAGAEVEAFAPAEDDIAGRRALAVAALEVFDRLTAGELVPDIAATLPPIGKATWQLPTDRDPEDVRVDQLRPGDLIKGMWDRGNGGRNLWRGFAGVVATVGEMVNRHEVGQFRTVTLTDGAEKTVQTHVWFAAFPISK